jgi:hypothetical protein
MPFRFTVRNGKTEFSSTAAAFRYAQWLKDHEGAKCVIDVEKADRSLSQLGMYRAWLANVAGHTGNDEEELHAFLLDKCAPRVVVKIKGKRGEVDVEQIKRTSGGHSLSMDKTEMSAFMEKCAALTGYPLPTEEDLISMGYIPN